MLYVPKKITWEFKDEKAIKNGCFVLYRNGKEVYRGDEFEYINPYLEDIEKPRVLKISALSMKGIKSYWIGKSPRIKARITV